jgi:hypothetical protein
MGRAAGMVTDLACIAGLYAFCLAFWPMAVIFELLRSKRGPYIFVAVLTAYCLTVVLLRSGWAVPVGLWWAGRRH